MSYQAALNNDLSLNLFGSAWGGRGAGFWDGSVQGQTSTVPSGTLVVGLYDPARKQLIWRGGCKQDHRHQQEPGQELQEPGKGDGQAVRELST